MLKCRGYIRRTPYNMKTRPYSAVALLALSASAHAQAAQQPNPLMSMLPLVIIFILFYFMLIRPQMKRAKEQKKMLESLQKGDEIVTASGQVGRVTKVGEQYVSLEIADGVTTHVQKSAVQTLLPKGTIKGI
jgi:preprotein translocase subunit YajC